MEFLSNIGFSEEEDRLIIRIPEVFDVSNSYKIKNDILKLIEKHNKNVVFDMSKTTFIDSSGIGIAIMLFKKLSKNNKKLSLRNVSGMVKECLDIAKINKFIDID
jgi:anti-sigma B factor antagonist